MADLIYPLTLPNPSVSAVTPAERRLLSEVTGGPEQTRGLQRDYLGTQRAEWTKLSAVEAAAFDAWYSGTLLNGGAWFSAVWPGPQGWVSLVRKFVRTPKWSHRAGGFWDVSAELQVRGRGLAPTDCLTDTFTGGIGQYTLISGSLAPFAASPVGLLRTTATSAADNISRIARPLSSPRVLASVSMQFKLRSIGSDDACLAALYSGATLQVALNPKRETFYDGARQVHVYIGAFDYAVAPSLSVGPLYEMSLSMPAGAPTVCTVTNLDTGVVVATTSLGVQASYLVDSLVFYVDAAAPGALCETDYSYIHVC